MKNDVKINLDEFTWGFFGSTSGKHYSNVSRHSRRDKMTSCRVFVEDKTTGLREEISIPEGHYSKKEMQKLRLDAIDKLVDSLLKKRKNEFKSKR